MPPKSSSAFSTLDASSGGALDEEENVSVNFPIEISSPVFRLCGFTVDCARDIRHFQDLRRDVSRARISSDLVSESAHKIFVETMARFNANE